MPSRTAGLPWGWRLALAARITRRRVSIAAAEADALASSWRRSATSHGGGPPRAFAGAAAKAVSAWSDLGRPGRPRLWGMGYFALGEGTADAGAKYLRHYYAFTGPFAEKIAAGNLTSPGAIADFIRGYEDTGCDELVLFPTVSGIEQIDRLAEVIG